MSDYFERIERQLLDAVERNARPARRGFALRSALTRDGPGGSTRRATRTRAHARVAIGSATFLAVVVALTAAVGLWSTGAGHRDAANTPAVAAGSLPASLEVLRRPQVAGDAPPRIVAAARAAVRGAPAPFAGTIDPAFVRRLTFFHELSGLSIYIAPVRPHEPGAPIDAALVLLSDRGGTRVWRPYELTANALRDGAVYFSFGFRARPARDGRSPGRAPSPPPHGAAAIPGTLSRGMRSLQIQIVPDGVASVDYAFPTEPWLFGTRTQSVRSTASGNAVVVALNDRLSGAAPVEATARARSGAVVQHAVPSTRGRGELDARSVCGGVALPPGPTRTPLLRTLPVTLPELCRQFGPPLRAFRRDPDFVLVLYPSGTLVGANRGRAALLTHLPAGTRFPPPMLVGLPPAPRLP